MSVNSSSNAMDSLEKFAKTNSWNSYLSATNQPENILENAFTEVGLFTRIVEAIREAFGLESSMSSKALGERLITVLDTLQTNEVQIDAKHLTTLITLATRAKVFGNKNEEKDYLPLANRLKSLDADVKQLQALNISEESKTPKVADESEEVLDLFPIEDDTRELVSDATELVVDSAKIEDVAKEIKKPKRKPQQGVSVGAFMWKAAKQVSIAAAITGVVFMAGSWNSSTESSSNIDQKTPFGPPPPPQCPLETYKNDNTTFVNNVTGFNNPTLFNNATFVNNKPFANNQPPADSTTAKPVVNNQPPVDKKTAKPIVGNTTLVDETTTKPVANNQPPVDRPTVKPVFDNTTLAKDTILDEDVTVAQDVSQGYFGGTFIGPKEDVEPTYMDQAFARVVAGHNEGFASKMERWADKIERLADKLGLLRHENLQTKTVVIE